MPQTSANRGGEKANSDSLFRSATERSLGNGWFCVLEGPSTSGAGGSSEWGAGGQARGALSRVFACGLGRRSSCRRSGETSRSRESGFPRGSWDDASREKRLYL